MVSVYGRVPMFYYLIHIYVIHLVALVASAFTAGQDWHKWLFNKPVWFTTDMKGYGFSLPVTYLVWIAIVVALYPLCKRYDAYKQSQQTKMVAELFVRVFHAYPFRRLSSKPIAHSERRLFTGFAIAAFIAWKLMVASAIIIAASPPAANSHQLMLMR